MGTAKTDIRRIADSDPGVNPAEQEHFSGHVLWSLCISCDRHERFYDDGADGCGG